MLTELLISLTAKAVPGARARGLPDELAGIAGRYRRQKAAWAPHLQHTKECIGAHLHEADANEPVLVLGAGLCLDLPLAALNAHPGGAQLVDAIEPLALRWRLRRFPNLGFERADLTGFLEPFSTADDAYSLVPPTTAPIPLAGYSLVVSCNILSQLPLAFASSPPLNAAEKILSSALQKAHVRALMSMQCPVLMISDFERHETEGGHHRVINSVDPSLLPGEPFDTWDWHIAPKGEAGRTLDICLKVGAWRLGT